MKFRLVSLILIMFCLTGCSDDDQSSQEQISEEQTDELSIHNDVNEIAGAAAAVDKNVAAEQALEETSEMVAQVVEPMI